MFHGKYLLGTGKHLMNSHSYNMPSAKLINASHGLRQMTIIHSTFYNMHTCICKVGANISRVSWLTN